MSGRQKQNMSGNKDKELSAFDRLCCKQFSFSAVVVGSPSNQTRWFLSSMGSVFMTVVNEPHQGFKAKINKFDLGLYILFPTATSVNLWDTSLEESPSEILRIPSIAS